ncbi:MAG: hypothetical protein U0P30_09190 [Vicinamibacterales bacterium]
MVPSVETFYAAVHPDDVLPRAAYAGSPPARRGLPTKELEIRMRFYIMVVTGGSSIRGRWSSAGPTGGRVACLGTISISYCAQAGPRGSARGASLVSRALFDKSPMIVTLVDVTTGRIAEGTRWACRPSATRGEEAVGRRSISNVRTRRRASTRQRIPEHGAVSGMEMEQRRDGRTFWALASATLVTSTAARSRADDADVTERRGFEGRVRQAQKMEGRPPRRRRRPRLQ